VKDRPVEDKPTAVPAMATQVGEVRARWAWTEPAVWTERMLTALEQGVKGGKSGPTINAGLMLSLRRRGCSLLLPPRRSYVNPLRGEPLTGEPDAGDPPVRFGGRGSETNRLSLPLSKNVHSSSCVADFSLCGPLRPLVEPGWLEITD
jgi:hypothetical protein